MFESFNALVNEPMSEHTTLKLGGPADYLVFPRSAEEIGALFAEAGAYNLPVTVIGHVSSVSEEKSLTKIASGQPFMSSCE